MGGLVARLVGDQVFPVLSVLSVLCCRTGREIYFDQVGRLKLPAIVNLECIVRHRCERLYDTIENKNTLTAGGISPVNSDGIRIGEDSKGKADVG